MAAFGTKGMAANHFVFRYMSVSFMPAFGISVAVTALVGRYIGRGQPDRYVVDEGPAKGMKGYFRRAADGSVDAVHMGGRLATRVP